MIRSTKILDLKGQRELLQAEVRALTFLVSASRGEVAPQYIENHYIRYVRAMHAAHATPELIALTLRLPVSTVNEWIA